MNIITVSKPDKTVTVTLSTDELVKLGNVLYNAPTTDKNELYYQLNSEIIIARDLCQYGHLDDFSLKSIIKSQNNISNKLFSVLTKDEIDTFNSYLEDGDIRTAFGNSDFTSIYHKIVGNQTSPTLNDLMQYWSDKANE